MFNKIYNANSQQTVFDVALQFYGDIEGAAYLLEDNPGLIDAQGNIDLSKPLKIRKAVINNIVLANYDGYIPVTNGTDDGINYVLIDDNNDFLTDQNGDTPIGF